MRTYLTTVRIIVELLITQFICVRTIVLKYVNRRYELHRYNTRRFMNFSRFFFVFFSSSLHEKIVCLVSAALRLTTTRPIRISSGFCKWPDRCYRSINNLQICWWLNVCKRCKVWTAPWKGFASCTFWVWRKNLTNCIDHLFHRYRYTTYWKKRKLWKIRTWYTRPITVTI